MLFISALMATAMAALELNSDTFDKTIKSGKGTFVKFLAPWWGHCKKMKPDWDKLSTLFKDSPVVTVADVDCTTEGKDVCSKVGVSGYPTIKYYLADSPDKPVDYSGGRDFDSLKKFIEKTFKAGCDPSTKESCNKSQIEVIDLLAGKSAEDLKTYIKEQQDIQEKTAEERKKYTEESKEKIKDLKKTEEGYFAKELVGQKFVDKLDPPKKKAKKGDESSDSD